MKLVYCSANIYLLLYISHFLRIISCRHLKHTAGKSTCAWEFKKPFIFCFITLCCIQAKINEQVSRGFTKLKKDFDLDDITVSKVFLNLLSISSETFIRSFQLKLLDDIVFTNKRLAKIGYVLHDTCTFCKVETETTYH